MSFYPCTNTILSSKHNLIIRPVFVLHILKILINSKQTSATNFFNFQMLTSDATKTLKSLIWLKWAKALPTLTVDWTFDKKFSQKIKYNKQISKSWTNYMRNLTKNSNLYKISFYLTACFKNIYYNTTILTVISKKVTLSLGKELFVKIFMIKGIGGGRVNNFFTI